MKALGLYRANHSSELLGSRAETVVECTFISELCLRRYTANVTRIGSTLFHIVDKIPPMTASDYSHGLLTAFGEAVRHRRQELGLTQQELAFHAQMSRSYVTDIERSIRNIAIKNLAKLAMALQLEMSQLLHRTECILREHQVESQILREG